MAEQLKQGDVPPLRCQFWLPRKARFCASFAIANTKYCGNHKPSSVETRVPCPVDPSHSVLQAELKAHMRKCPGTVRIQQLERMEFYAKGVNAGSDDDNSEGIDDSSCVMQDDFTATASASEFGRQEVDRKVSNGFPSYSGFLSSKMKRAMAAMLFEEKFMTLVRKVEAAYCVHCENIFEEAFEHPSACSTWLNGEVDRTMPFQLKHASQQASLLGNMEKFGLLQHGRIESIPQESAHLKPVYIEFGAGRGYLAHMLADCYGVEKVILVERRSYKFKADRTLRQRKVVSFERLRIDIENLDLRRVKSLQGCHYVALSKHLCGCATDLALRCCYPNSVHAYSKSLCSVKIKGGVNIPESVAPPTFDGLAIATCCHHLCQWKSYVNKKFIINMGFSKEDFNILTWLTGWALSGNKEHSSNYSNDLLSSEFSTLNHTDQSLSRKPEGFATNKECKGLDVLKNCIIQTADRVALGLKCKHLLDVGRSYWLREHGLDAKLVNYVPSSISPENKLLLAKRSDILP